VLLFNESTAVRIEKGATRIARWRSATRLSKTLPALSCSAVEVGHTHSTVWGDDHAAYEMRLTVWATDAAA